jgi:hypothetical protein
VKYLFPLSISCHTREIRGDTSLGETCAISFGHIQWMPLEALVYSGIISQTDNGKRGRERPNLT